MRVDAGSTTVGARMCEPAADVGSEPDSGCLPLVRDSVVLVESQSRPLQAAVHQSVTRLTERGERS